MVGAIRRDARSAKPASMGSELALLGICILSGVVGVYFQDVVILCTIFVGGLGTWIMMGIPAWIESTKARLAAESDVTKPDDTSKPSRPELPPANQVLNLIKARRSIFTRDYTGGKVPKEHIDLLLEAANWAPTHNLTQPWRFTVLEGEGKAQFEKLTLECVGKYTQPAEKAVEALERIQGKAKKTWPLVSHYIVLNMVRVPTGKGGKFNPEWEEIAAVSSAAQNIQLMATALGVACYWSSWQAVARDAPEMLTFLELDAAAGDKCLGVISLGLTERTDSYRGSRSPVQDKVRWIS